MVLLDTLAARHRLMCTSDKVNCARVIHVANRVWHLIASTKRCSQNITTSPREMNFLAQHARLRGKTSPARFPMSPRFKRDGHVSTRSHQGLD